jgi:hypothetical protein
LFVRLAIGKPLAGRTNVNVPPEPGSEVLFAEAPSALEFEVIGFGDVT